MTRIVLVLILLILPVHFKVDASRRTMLEDLPPVLILHLKCFVYDKNGGCQKVVKKVDFSNELEISKGGSTGEIIDTFNKSHLKNICLQKHNSK